MKKMEVVIERLTKDATGVVRIEKKPLYIKYALPNEKILCELTYEGKKNIYGKINTILDKSKDRVKAKCETYYKCGGCHISHMNYDAQLKFKTDVVKKLYANFNNVTIYDCKGMNIPYYYRNKVQVPVGKKKNKIIAGFFQEESHDIVPFDNCLVQDKLSNKIVKEVIKAMQENKIEPYNEDSQEGIVRHILIRRAKEETMLVLITKVDSFPGRNNFVKSIKKKLPEITTIIQNINKRKTNVILGEKENILYGKGFIKDILCGITFKISPKSFYQINKIQCENLYNKAIELANLSKDDVILDAYCGIGTIGMIASKHVKEVYGVEIIKDAIDDANKNAIENKISNCHFYCADAKDFIKEMKAKLDVVFVDPPRKGCDESFLKTLVKNKIKKIVYISCNPETQVRDVTYLVNNGYTFDSVYPFDMFPQTHHVETIVLLERR